MLGIPDMAVSLSETNANSYLRRALSSSLCVPPVLSDLYWDSVGNEVVGATYTAAQGFLVLNRIYVVLDMVYYQFAV